MSKETQVVFQILFFIVGMIVGALIKRKKKPADVRFVRVPAPKV